MTAGAVLLKGLPLVKLLLVDLHLLSAARGPSNAEVAEMLGGYSPWSSWRRRDVVRGGPRLVRWLLRIITQRGLTGSLLLLGRRGAPHLRLAGIRVHCGGEKLMLKCEQAAVVYPEPSARP